jgi:Eco57I restriction-modification methylase/restriction endonuclease TaqI-like protein/N-6 DNA methylase
VANTEQNYYQALTSPGKLRGRYYTPDALVAMMLDAARLAPGDLVLDPACGDGSFLRGAVAALARRFPDADRQTLAEAWAGRLVGFDVDPGAVAEAREGLQAAFREHLGVDLPAACLRLRQADVLHAADLGSLLQVAGIPCLRQDERLVVVGNPPYVEAKRLARETTGRLKARYPAAVAGAPDLYLYFLHVCLGWLRADDLLAFVLPNKLLVNSNAQRLRERLLEEGRLRALWFATQAAIFADAAVYPIVLFASGVRTATRERVEIARIARGAGGAIARSAPVSGDPAWYGQTAARALFPLPETPALREALAHMLASNAALRLGDLLDIRWTVSFHHAGLRERYVIRERPDDPDARPFLGGGPFAGNGEVTRYRLAWVGWWIRYAAAELQGLKNPLPDPRLFERPKVVICQNGRTLRAAYDEAGYALKDTFLCGLLREGDHPLCRHPRAIVGLLCSRAVHFFYSHVFYGGHVNGGYLHFLRSFLIDIPVGSWTEASAEEAAVLVRQRETAPEADWGLLEERIEALVSTALGLSEKEQAAIAAWAAKEANWQARERVRKPAGADPVMRCRD